MKSLRLYDEAEDELEKIFHYYAQDDADVTIRFYQEIVDGFSRILRHPKMAPLIAESHRKLVLRKFHYNIIYRETADTIYIVAIAHQSRKPSYWEVRD